MDRAIVLMDFLAREGRWCSVTEMAGELQVHKSTVVRLLGTLQTHRLVERDLQSSKYRLGLGVLRWAGAVTDEIDIVRRAQPVCERLRSETGESVNAAIRDGDMVVNIAQSLPASSLVSQNWLGKRAPLHCTSTGKVLLAHMSDAERERIVAKPLEALTEHTVVDADRLRRELSEVRSKGYARALEELEVGLNAVAAPIWSAQGEVIAAVSVAGPADRLSTERLPEVAELSKAAALDISRALGFAN